jgi:CheY-like chemotaxis protein
MKKILVVDDDEGIRHLMVRVLSQAGYPVTAAACGEEGWQRVEQGIAEVVVTDWAMPKGNGSWLVGEIMKRPRPLPVLIVTSTSRDQCVPPEWEKAGVRHLQKPFQYKQLLEEVAALARG